MTIDTPFKSFALTSKGILKNNAHLSSFLGTDDFYFVSSKSRRTLSQCDAVLAWGKKPSAKRAESLANEQGLPLLRLEDGFLRSFDGGINSRFAASMVVDDVGVYFDNHHSSRLEKHIFDKERLTLEEKKRCERLIQNIISERLSKYNLAPRRGLETETDKNILIVDQTYGDQSVAGAGASELDFHRMLEIAQSNHPNATLWIKTHPQAKNNRLKKRSVGYFSQLTNNNPRIKKITTAFNPISLIQQMDAVYVVSSHMGFEALMCNKPVYCFGVPWYAGWGLTEDIHAPQGLLNKVRQRRQYQSATLLQLFYSAYIDYSRYVNPATAKRCEIEEVIQWLVTNRYWQRVFSQKSLDFFKLSAWKLNFIPHFFGLPLVKRRFKYFLFLNKQHQQNHVAIAWGRKQAKRAALHYPDVWCMEDGFIRSRGLGAELIAPASIVLDRQGIYYDSSQPSDLECLLNELELTAEQNIRAEKIRRMLLQTGVSKYNVGGEFLWPRIPKGKYVILVPGQVEDDASVLLSQSSVKTNAALLKSVRENEPDAFIIYKPHPDVQAKLRKGYVSPAEISRFADAVVDKISMPSCLENVHAVHTISSLTGFEALLRGCDVTCYGLPFYAGWGLTQDKVNSPQRIRKHNLNALVYAALIRYPIYQLPHGYGLAEAEEVIDYLRKPAHVLNQKQWHVKNIMRLRLRLLSYMSRLLA